MGKKLPVIQNREAWLNDIAAKLTPPIETAAKKVLGTKAKMPPLLISVGFPSSRGLSEKKRVLGECWGKVATKDGRCYILINPVLTDVMEIVGVVAHEQTHAIVGTEHGHKGPFVHVIREIGLTGKPTATTPGQGFIKLAEPLIQEIGYELPHTPLLPGFGKHKVQSTRMLKASCLKCGYVARLSKKWILEAGAPICPTHKTQMFVDPSLIEDDE